MLLNTETPNGIFVYDSFIFNYPLHMYMKSKYGKKVNWTGDKLLSGYMMIDMLTYPVIFFTGRSSDVIRGETFEVSNEALQEMRRMISTRQEVTEEIVSINDRTYLIYVCNNITQVIKRSIIQNGDWKEKLPYYDSIYYQED